MAGSEIKTRGFAASDAARHLAPGSWAESFLKVFGSVKKKTKTKPEGLVAKCCHRSSIRSLFWDSFVLDSSHLHELSSPGRVCA